jgi:hypothetical protein
MAGLVFVHAAAPAPAPAQATNGHDRQPPVISPPVSIDGQEFALHYAPHGDALAAIEHVRPGTRVMAAEARYDLARALLVDPWIQGRIAALRGRRPTA